MLELHLIAHNIRSIENVGSLFRTADALGVAKIWITGYSPAPTHNKVSKTALGAEKVVAYEVDSDVDQVIKKLHKNGFKIVGLEIDRRAQKLHEYKIDKQKIALLLGNEVEGILPYLRDLCDDLIYIPQKGVKESLNVAVATGIACYELMLN